MTRRRYLPDDDDISAFRQALQAAGVRRIATNQADPGKPKRNDDAQQARRQAAVESNTFATSGRTSDGRVEAVRPPSIWSSASRIYPGVPSANLSAARRRGKRAWIYMATPWKKPAPNWKAFCMMRLLRGYAACSSCTAKHGAPHQIFRC